MSVRNDLERRFGDRQRRRAPCPVCNRGPRDTALSVTTDHRGTVAHCFRCGYVKADNHASTPHNRATAKAHRPWRDVSEHLWGSSESLHGSLAAMYLRRRGCRLPPVDGDLRFLPARGDHPAAMLGRVTDAITAQPISLHFTHLNADGTKVSEHSKSLLAGHRKAGGVIRLWPDEAVTLGLAVAEGIESALAAAHGFTPVWAAIDAGNLSAFPVLKGIEALTIVADHDQTGLLAAFRCAQRWADAGRTAWIATPPVEGQDAADLVALAPEAA